MKNTYSIDFSSCLPVNDLWPQIVHRFGIVNAQNAVRQALDLQLMQGGEETLPVLLSETCGIALTRIDSFYDQTGIFCSSYKMVLILSIRNKHLQLLREIE